MTAVCAQEAIDRARDVIRQGRGQPLEPAVRRFMESRFQTSFEQVRVHDSPVAATAARALDAHAFACGRDIVFGQRAYQPDRAAGLRLLAHELAHVCQQRLSSEKCSLPQRIGPIHDPWEQQAELAAERILSDQPLPVFRADNARMLRRAVNLDLASARIVVMAEEAKPRSEGIHNAQVSQMAYHLSKGSNGTNTPVVFAFEFLGDIVVKSGTKAELDGWKFGFIQFGKQGIMTFVFQGRKPEEGHVLVDVSAEIGTAFMLDLHPSATQRPFYLDPSFSLASFNDQLILETHMGDHPFLSIADKVENTKTGFTNYLYAVADSRQFMSVFAAQKPDGTFVLLAHVEWFLTYSEKYRWKSGQIASKEELSSFRPDKTSTLGPPKNVELAGGMLKKLGSLTGPTYNDKSKPALTRAFVPGNPNRFDNNGFYPLSPANFWT